MPSIKVVYNSICRRMSVDEDSEWQGITQYLSKLFQLPSSSVFLEYTDCDNDTIVLDTIKELFEAIGSGIQKFNISNTAPVSNLLPTSL